MLSTVKGVKYMAIIALYKKITGVYIVTRLNKWYVPINIIAVPSEYITLSDTTMLGT